MKSKRKIKNATKKAKRAKIPNWLNGKKPRKKKTKTRARRKTKRLKAVSKTKTSKKRKTKRRRMMPMHIKVSRSHLAALKLKAKKHAGGVLSVWLRYAGLRYTPKRGEIIKA